jgi:hypothetical protein
VSVGRLGEDPSVSAGTSFGAALGGRSLGVMNSRRPQGEGPDPGYVWTDEPPDPTTFTLMLLRAVAEPQRWRAQYDQGQNRGRCCGQCFGNGNDPLLRGLPALALTR